MKFDSSLKIYYLEDKWYENNKIYIYVHTNRIGFGET